MWKTLWIAWRPNIIVKHLRLPASLAWITGTKPALRPATATATHPSRIRDSDAAKSSWMSLLRRKKRVARLAAGDSGGVEPALCYERLNPTTGGDDFKRNVAACAVSWRMG